MVIDNTVFYDIQVSYYKNFKSSVSLSIPVRRVLNGIKSGTFKDIVMNVRRYKNVDKEKSDEYKQQLHAVTFSGLFERERKAALCSHYNNLMVIDIDHLSDEQLPRVRQCLHNDPFVAAFWQSPSGYGFKGLVHLYYSDSLQAIDLSLRHKSAFQRLFLYFMSNYQIELDRSGSDVSRLCFMSWDPYIEVKDSAESFDVEDISLPAKKRKYATNKSEHGSDISLDWNSIVGRSNYPMSNYYRFQLNNIYKKLQKKGLSITDNYEDWVKVAFAIASTIHPVKGRELFLKLCSLDGVNHDEKRSEHLIHDAYMKTKNLVSFNSIISLAKQKGLYLNT